MIVAKYRATREYNVTVELTDNDGYVTRVRMVGGPNCSYNVVAEMFARDESHARTRANLAWSNLQRGIAADHAYLFTALCDWCHKPGTQSRPLLFGRSDTLAHDECDRP